MGQRAKTYIKRMTNPLTFKFGMLKMLPSAFFWGFKVEGLDENRCVVSIPYNWNTKNPFQSIYFAALAGAAELSTGALCQLAMADRGKYSMLVVDFRAEYSKKANQKITFTCDQGKEVSALLERLQEDQSERLTMLAIGHNPQGEEVARFYVTWSFKKKAIQSKN
jgi:acyl-coenzyme A thioesterase PaaI-like protein